jgi:hypothetical protein
MLVDIDGILLLTDWKDQCDPRSIAKAGVTLADNCLLELSDSLFVKSL